MINKPKTRLPRYQQVAVDVANRIAQNEFKVGDKLHARSKLASYYKVSPETARKAVSILVDLDIVTVKHGSGFSVASASLAKEFIEQYQDVQSIQDLKTMMEQSMIRQQEELSFFSGVLDNLLVQTNNFYTANPMNPFQIKVSDKCEYLNETIGEINLWQKTYATLIAIDHQGELGVSPGPYAQIQEGDLLYFVGTAASIQRVENYFYPND
ncbi:GntR family transcriptional regulator [Vagococcus salmoninarum]|uniref:GntR family transcriptional regulator n=1 Tax=Vagococcus salmoninarum TaxID=2739 RepID=UPI003F9D354A